MNEKSQINAKLDYLRKTLKGVAGKADRDGFGSLSTEQQTALMAFYAQGVIDNGGFNYFFEEGLDAVELRNSYERLGLTAPAEIVRQISRILPLEVCPQERSERIRWFRTVGGSVSFDDLDESIYRCRSQVISGLFDYVKLHESEIGKGLDIDKH
jgi:hypothetical protein